jgi:tetratricopeptide (TPR) repeat protein
VGNKGAVSLVLSGLGRAAQVQGSYKEATTLLEESLAFYQDLGDRFAVASGLNELGLVALSQGDYERAAQMHEHALAISHEAKNPFLTSTALRNLGVAAMAQDDYKRATKSLEESLAISRETRDDLETAFVLHYMGRVGYLQVDFTSARRFNREALLIFHELADRSDMARGVARCLSFVALIAVAQKQMKRAACLFGASEKLYAPLRFEMSAKERDEHDQAIAIARAALGGAAFTETWEEGRKLTLEEAVACALEEQ